MRAVTIANGKVTIDEHPDPAPGTGQLLVRVRSAGLNNADLMQTAGFYPPPPGYPVEIPGLEFAGEVVARGPDVTRWSPGDRVMAVTGGGGQAELATIHEREAIPVPDQVPWEAAGGFPEAYATAHDALFTQCGLSPGEHLLVHGAAGGVGTAAVQLGITAGCAVTATVRTADVRADVAALGATVTAPDAFADAGPFDVILELVGAPNMDANLAALATGGRISVIGVGAGGRADINLLGLMQKRGRIYASTLRARPLEEKAAVARGLEHHVVPLLAAGRITVPVLATYDLDDVAAAYERFAQGGKFGKIVLTMP